jgi:hypothetical protein
MKLIKACQNDNCDSKGDGKLYAFTDKYCAKCGQPFCPSCIDKND